MRLALGLFAAALVLAAALMMLSRSLENPDPPPLSVSEPPTAAAEVIRLSETVIPNSYNLDLTIRPGEETFSGFMAIRVTLSEATDQIILHGQDLTVSRTRIITRDGRSIGGRWRSLDENDGVARIDLEEIVPPGPAKLLVDYTGRIQAEMAGLYGAEAGGDAYVLSQLQPLGARRVMPVFDEPRFKAPYTLTVTTGADNRVLSNAPLAETRRLRRNEVTYRFKPTAAIPSYGLAVMVGPFETIETEPLPPTRWRKSAVPVRAHMPRSAKGSPIAMMGKARTLALALEAFHQSAYAFDKLDLIAMPRFGFWIMENPGAIAMRANELLQISPEPDDLPDMLVGLLAHGLAHQWMGNQVTPEWWDDLWLSEAFATWVSAQVLAEDFGVTREQLLSLTGGFSAMDQDGLSEVRRVHQPIETRADIEGSFDIITYQKGAALLRMMANYLGEEDFRAAVVRHFDRFQGDSARTEDFIRSLAQVSGRGDVAVSLSTFLYQTGVPLAEVALSCADRIGLTVRQSRYIPLGGLEQPDQNWVFPFCYAYEIDGVRRRDCAMIEEAEQTITLPEDRCPDWVMPNDRAAGYYRWVLDDGSREALLASTSDLSQLENLAVMDSLHGAFSADVLSVEDYIDALVMFSQSPDTVVATAPLRYFTGLRQLIEAPADTRKLNALIGRLYGDRLAQARDPMARNRISWALTQAGTEGTGIDRILADRAIAVLAQAGSRNDDLDSLAVSLRHAIAEQGEAAVDKAIKLITATDRASLQVRLAMGLSQVPDADVQDRVLPLSLDPMLDDQAARLLLTTEAPTRDVAERRWAFLQENMRAYLDLRNETAGPLIDSLRGLCSNRAADELVTFAENNPDLMVGQDQLLTTVLSSMRQCAILGDRKQAELRAYFTSG